MVRSAAIPGVAVFLLLNSLIGLGGVPSQSVSTTPLDPGVTPAADRGPPIGRSSVFNERAAASRIVSVNVSGPGYIHTRESTIYLWDSTPVVVTVEFTFATARANDRYTMCLIPAWEEAADNASRCTEITRAGAAVTYRNVTYHGPAASYRVRFTVDEWPTRTPNPQRSRITFTRVANRSDPLLDDRALSIQVFHRDGDFDTDNLPNQHEVRVGTALTNADTDGDGLRDGNEVDGYGTDPLNPDTDGDGARDAVEIQQGTDPLDPADEPTDRRGGVSSAPLVVVGIVLVVGIVGLGWLRLAHPDLISRSRWMGDGAPDAADGAIVTDAERVIQLVEQHGGRAKQNDIVDATGWSKAKTSRILAEMEETDAITRVRIGRENLVCTEGNEPPATQSNQ